MNICYVGGAGRLGSALAAWSAECGHKVTIADTNARAVHDIRNGKFESSEPDVAQMLSRNSANIEATTDIARAVSTSEVIYIIVPTPSNDDGSFSISYILDTFGMMKGGLADNPDPLLVIVSTVNPGDTAALSSAMSNHLDREIQIVYSPEFVAQGSIIKDFANPDVLLIGANDDRAAALALKAYEGVVNPGATHVMSTVSAEIAKIGLNAALVTKTAVAAQLMWLCHNIPGADARDVLGSVGADKRIGSKFFAPGLRPGGPCLPRDNHALAAACKAADSPHSIASAMKTFRTELESDLYGLVFDKSEGNILVVGLTYKPGVPMMGESAGMALYEDLRKSRPVRGYDETVPADGPLDDDIAWADTVVIATRRPPEMDLAGKIVIDCWGKYEGNCDKHIILGVGL